MQAGDDVQQLLIVAGIWQHGMSDVVVNIKMFIEFQFRLGNRKICNPATCFGLWWDSVRRKPLSMMDKLVIEITPGSLQSIRDFKYESLITYSVIRQSLCV